MSSIKTVFILLIILQTGFTLPAFSQDQEQPTLELVGTISDVIDFEWFASENKLLVHHYPSYNQSQSLCIWDSQSNLCNDFQSFELVFGAKISPDNQLVAFGLTYNVQVLDMATQSTLADINIIEEDQGGGILGLAWSPDGDYLAVGGIKSVHIFNTSTWLEEKTLILAPLEHVVAPRPLVLEWSPTGLYLAVEYESDAPSAYTLNIFSVDSANLVYTDLTRGGIQWVQGGELFSYLGGSGIMVLDGATLEYIKEYTALNSQILSWSPDGNYFSYTLSEAGILVIIDTTTGNVVSEQAGYGEQNFIEASAWSPDGNYIAILAHRHLDIYRVNMPAIGES